MASEQQLDTITYVVGDPYDTETNPRRRQENARRLIGAMRLPWTDRDHRKWSTFAMLWVAVASVPACCDDYESAERQSVLWAERAAAMVKR